LHEEEAAARHEWHDAASFIRRATNDGGGRKGLSTEHQSRRRGYEDQRVAVGDFHMAFRYVEEAEERRPTLRPASEKKGAVGDDPAPTPARHGAAEQGGLVRGRTEEDLAHELVREEPAFHLSYTASISSGRYRSVRT
jgi:hypothetical protein